jgi:hypothetical protein
LPTPQASMSLPSNGSDPAIERANRWGNSTLSRASRPLREIVTEWPKLHSLDGDSSATLQTTKVQTIPEYLEEERQKAADTRLRTEKEAARIQPLRHGHHRKVEQSRLEMVPPAKAATQKKKKTKTVTVARQKPRVARKKANKIRKRA